MSIQESAVETALANLVAAVQNHQDPDTVIIPLIQVYFETKSGNLPYNLVLPGYVNPLFHGVDIHLIGIAAYYQHYGLVVLLLQCLIGSNTTCLLDMMSTLLGVSHDALAERLTSFRQFHVNENPSVILSGGKTISDYLFPSDSRTQFAAQLICHPSIVYSFHYLIAAQHISNTSSIIYQLVYDQLYPCLLFFDLALGGFRQSASFFRGQSSSCESSTENILTASEQVQSSLVGRDDDKNHSPLPRHAGINISWCLPFHVLYVLFTAPMTHYTSFHADLLELVLCTFPYCYLFSPHSFYVVPGLFVDSSGNQASGTPLADEYFRGLSLSTPEIIGLTLGQSGSQPPRTRCGYIRHASPLLDHIYVEFINPFYYLFTQHHQPLSSVYFSLLYTLVAATAFTHLNAELPSHRRGINMSTFRSISRSMVYSQADLTAHRADPAASHLYSSCVYYYPQDIPYIPSDPSNLDKIKPTKESPFYSDRYCKYLLSPLFHLFQRQDLTVHFVESITDTFKCSLFHLFVNYPRRFGFPVAVQNNRADTPEQKLRQEDSIPCHLYPLDDPFLQLQTYQYLASRLGITHEIPTTTTTTTTSAPEASSYQLEAIQGTLLTLYLTTRYTLNQDSLQLLSYLAALASSLYRDVVLLSEFSRIASAHAMQPRYSYRGNTIFFTDDAIRPSVLPLVEYDHCAWFEYGEPCTQSLSVPSFVDRLLFSPAYTKYEGKRIRLRRGADDESFNIAESTFNSQLDYILILPFIPALSLIPKQSFHDHIEAQGEGPCSSSNTIDSSNLKSLVPADLDHAVAPPRLLSLPIFPHWDRVCSTLVTMVLSIRHCFFFKQFDNSTLSFSFPSVTVTSNRSSEKQHALAHNTQILFDFISNHPSYTDPSPVRQLLIGCAAANILENYPQHVSRPVCEYIGLSIHSSMLHALAATLPLLGIDRESDSRPKTDLASGQILSTLYTLQPIATVVCAALNTSFPSEAWQPLPSLTIAHAFHKAFNLRPGSQPGLLPLSSTIDSVVFELTRQPQSFTTVLYDSLLPLVPVPLLFDLLVYERKCLPFSSVFTGRLSLEQSFLDVPLICPPPNTFEPIVYKQSEQNALFVELTNINKSIVIGRLSRHLLAFDGVHSLISQSSPITPNINTTGFLTYMSNVVDTYRSSFLHLFFSEYSHSHVQPWRPEHTQLHMDLHDVHALLLSTPAGGDASEDSEAVDLPPLSSALGSEYLRQHGHIWPTEKLIEKSSPSTTFNGYPLQPQRKNGGSSSMDAFPSVEWFIALMQTASLNTNAESFSHYQVVNAGVVTYGSSQPSRWVSGVQYDAAYYVLLTLFKYHPMFTLARQEMLLQQVFAEQTRYHVPSNEPDLDASTYRYKLHFEEPPNPPLSRVFETTAGTTDSSSGGVIQLSSGSSHGAIKEATSSHQTTPSYIHAFNASDDSLLNKTVAPYGMQHGVGSPVATWLLNSTQGGMSDAPKTISNDDLLAIDAGAGLPDYISTSQTFIARAEAYYLINALWSTFFLHADATLPYAYEVYRLFTDQTPAAGILTTHSAPFVHCVSPHATAKHDVDPQHTLYSVVSLQSALQLFPKPIIDGHPPTIPCFQPIRVPTCPTRFADTQTTAESNPLHQSHLASVINPSLLITLHALLPPSAIWALQSPQYDTTRRNPIQTLFTPTPLVHAISGSSPVIRSSLMIHPHHSHMLASMESQLLSKLYQIQLKHLEYIKVYNHFSKDHGDRALSAELERFTRVAYGPPSGSCPIVDVSSRSKSDGRSQPSQDLKPATRRPIVYVSNPTPSTAFFLVPYQVTLMLMYLHHLHTDVHLLAVKSLDSSSQKGVAEDGDDNTHFRWNIKAISKSLIYCTGFVELLISLVTSAVCTPTLAQQHFQFCCTISKYYPYLFDLTTQQKQVSGFLQGSSSLVFKDHDSQEHESTSVSAPASGFSWSEPGSPLFLSTALLHVMQDSSSKFTDQFPISPQHIERMRKASWDLRNCFPVPFSIDAILSIVTKLDLSSVSRPDHELAPCGGDICPSTELSLAQYHSLQYAYLHLLLIQRPTFRAMREGVPVSPRDILFHLLTLRQLNLSQNSLSLFYLLLHEYKQSNDHIRTAHANNKNKQHADDSVNVVQLNPVAENMVSAYATPRHLSHQHVHVLLTWVILLHLNQDQDPSSFLLKCMQPVHTKPTVTASATMKRPYLVSLLLQTQLYTPLTLDLVHGALQISAVHADTTDKHGCGTIHALVWSIICMYYRFSSSARGQAGTHSHFAPLVSQDERAIFQRIFIQMIGLGADPTPDPVFLECPNLMGLTPLALLLTAPRPLDDIAHWIVARLAPYATPPIPQPKAEQQRLPSFIPYIPQPSEKTVKHPRYPYILYTLSTCFECINDGSDTAHSSCRPPIHSSQFECRLTSPQASVSGLHLSIEMKSTHDVSSARLPPHVLNRLDSDNTHSLTRLLSLVSTKSFRPFTRSSPLVLKSLLDSHHTIDSIDLGNPSHLALNFMKAGVVRPPLPVPTLCSTNVFADFQAYCRTQSVPRKNLLTQPIVTAVTYTIESYLLALFYLLCDDDLPSQPQTHEFETPTEANGDGDIAMDVHVLDTAMLVAHYAPGTEPMPTTISTMMGLLEFSSSDYHSMLYSFEKLTGLPTTHPIQLSFFMPVVDPILLQNDIVWSCLAHSKLLPDPHVTSPTQFTNDQAEFFTSTLGKTFGKTQLRTRAYEHHQGATELLLGLLSQGIGLFTSSQLTTWYLSYKKQLGPFIRSQIEPLTQQLYNNARKSASNGKDNDGDSTLIALCSSLHTSLVKMGAHLRLLYGAAMAASFYQLYNVFPHIIAPSQALDTLLLSKGGPSATPNITEHTPANSGSQSDLHPPTHPVDHLQDAREVNYITVAPTYASIAPYTFIPHRTQELVSLTLCYSTHLLPALRFPNVVMAILAHPSAHVQNMIFGGKSSYKDTISMTLEDFLVVRSHMQEAISHAYNLPNKDEIKSEDHWDKLKHSTLTKETAQHALLFLSTEHGKNQHPTFHLRDQLLSWEDLDSATTTQLVPLEWFASQEIEQNVSLHDSDASEGMEDEELDALPASDFADTHDEPDDEMSFAFFDGEDNQQMDTTETRLHSCSFAAFSQTARRMNKDALITLADFEDVGFTGAQNDMEDCPSSRESPTSQHSKQLAELLNPHSFHLHCGILWYLVNTTTISLEDWTTLLSQCTGLDINPIHPVTLQSLFMIVLLRRYPANILMFLINAIGLGSILSHTDAYGRNVLDYLMIAQTWRYAPDVVSMLFTSYKEHHQHQHSRSPA